MNNRKELLIIILIVITAALLRFFNLMHDSPYFFDPDERNMGLAITQFKLPKNPSSIPTCLISQFVRNDPGSSSGSNDPGSSISNNCNLNPHFFAYGQFPLYLAYASDQIFKPITNISSSQPTTNNQPASPARLAEALTKRAGGQLTTTFDSAIFWLRFWSALTSSLTVLLVYLITKKLTSSIDMKNGFRLGGRNDKNINTGHFAAILAAFTPGAIQAAHFGTTESLLTFFFLGTVYFSLGYLSTSYSRSIKGFIIHNSKFIILNSFFIGLALGSKLTGLFFLIPPFLVLMSRFIEVMKNGFSGRLEPRRGTAISFGIASSSRQTVGTPRNDRWYYFKETSIILFIGVLVLIGIIGVFIVSSPYNLVDPRNFRSAVFGYELDVATGKYEAFYTRQFVNSVPILFQAEKIFPYALGWPVFIVGIMGFLLFNIQLFKYLTLSILSKYQISNIKYQKYIANIKKKGIFNILFVYLIFDFSFLIYFLPNAYLFAKWTRFMTPVFPFFAIFAGYSIFCIFSISKSLIHQYQISNIKNQIYISKIKKNKIFNILYIFFIFDILFFISLPGVAFMSIYTHEDSRVQASRWIYENIPDNSYILSETANVIDIPLGLPLTHNSQPTTHNYTVISFDFYHMDENPMIYKDLLLQLEKSNYILIPSRRIFANYIPLAKKYPLTTKYYQLLFSGQLGFEKTKEISSFPQLSMINYQLPDEQSEETYTVFDHPVIRIYRKVRPYNKEQFNLLFQN